MTYMITKRLGPFSTVFRNWRADGSHCQQLHGHDIYFEITLESDDLDPRGWVFDYAQFKQVREMINNIFDHRVLVAHDDPFLDAITALAQGGVLDATVVDEGPVSCEGFAKYVHDRVQEYLGQLGLPNKVNVASVRCYEQDNNSSVYSKKPLA